MRKRLAESGLHSREVRVTDLGDTATEDDEVSVECENRAGDCPTQNPPTLPNHSSCDRVGCRTFDRRLEAGGSTTCSQVSRIQSRSGCERFEVADFPATAAGNRVDGQMTELSGKMVYAAEKAPVD